MHSTNNKPCTRRKKQKKIAVIQGAQYTDLRIECAQKLEQLGYTTLMFANTDELQRNPQDLLSIIIQTRENINPNTTLYFPFATTQILPILTYLGIDLFDTSRAIYEAKNNNIMTNTNIYPQEKYNITDNIEQENIKQLKFTIKEIQENIKNKTLRNLTEQKAATNPEIMSLHRLLDKHYQNYLQKYTQLY
nr:archaeosine tRNA-ribosyltransferase [Methanosphaera sp. WGK6]